MAPAATSPGVAAARFCAALAAVPEGDGLPLPAGERPAPAEGAAGAGAEGPAEAAGWLGEAGLGDDGAPAVGLADDGLGVRGKTGWGCR